MFETLDDQIKHDIQSESTKTERFLRWAVAFVVTVLVLAGLYIGVGQID